MRPFLPKRKTEKQRRTKIKLEHSWLELISSRSFKAFQQIAQRWNHPLRNRIQNHFWPTSVNISRDAITRRGEERKKWSYAQSTRHKFTAMLLFLFFLFLIVVRPDITPFSHGMTREKRKRESRGHASRAARPPLKLIAHKMKRRFLWRRGRPITGVARLPATPPKPCRVFRNFLVNGWELIAPANGTCAASSRINEKKKRKKKKNYETKRRS